MNTFFSQHAHCRVRFHDFPGDGEPLVFIHGLGCASSYEYPRIVADPAFRRRRVILLDLPGSGFSEKPREYAYTTGDQARVVLELFDALALERGWLYGHSMGGAIAIEAAAMAGERLAGLAVSEPNFHPGGGFFSRAVTSHDEAEYVAGAHVQMIEQESPFWAGSLASNAPWAVWRSAASLVQGGAVDWYACFLALSKPKLLIFGEQSLPDADFASLSERGVPTAVIPDAGHSMSCENPSALARVLTDFCSDPTPR